MIGCWAATIGTRPPKTEARGVTIGGRVAKVGPRLVKTGLGLAKVGLGLVTIGVRLVTIEARPPAVGGVLPDLRADR
jgi:hypothetical protein